MSIGTIIWWCTGGYLAIGVFVTISLSQTPYADEAWPKVTLLWPVYVFAIMRR